MLRWRKPARDPEDQLPEKILGGMRLRRPGGPPAGQAPVSGPCKVWPVIQQSWGPPLALTPGNGQWGAGRRGRQSPPTNLEPVTRGVEPGGGVGVGRGIGPSPQPLRPLRHNTPSPGTCPASAPLPLDLWTGQGWVARLVPSHRARLGLTPPAQGKPRLLGPGPLSLKPAVLSLLSRCWDPHTYGLQQGPPPPHSAVFASNTELAGPWMQTRGAGFGG